MNLIFVTRKIDRYDSRTGFVFGWLSALASKADKLYVICQERGDISGLSGNVEVYSLGKERGRSKLFQGFKLFALSFSLGKKSDGTFCHMMPIYAIVTWLPAKILGKKMILWYTHKSVDWRLRLALFLVDGVFTASPESFRLKSKKVRVLGHGIDIEKFNAKSTKEHANTAKISYDSYKFRSFRIISVGRISPVKDYETLIKAVEILVNEKGVKDIRVDIYGEPALLADLAYLQSLREFVAKARLEDNVFFHGGVAYDKVPEIYASADLLVNLSKTGSLDKNVLEAAAAGLLVLTSNEAFAEKLLTISEDLVFFRDDPQGLSVKIDKLRRMSPSGRAELGNILKIWVESDHNLANLAGIIIDAFQKKEFSA